VARASWTLLLDNRTRALSREEKNSYLIQNNKNSYLKQAKKKTLVLHRWVHEFGQGYMARAIKLLDIVTGQHVSRRIIACM